MSGVVERLSLEAARALAAAALGQAGGVPSDIADCVGNALVAAEAEGQAGHGFSRLSDYAAQYRSGKINRAAQIQVQTRGPASLFIDADLGFAYPAMDAARAAGLPLAEAHGIAVMAIGNSHHCGALSVQVEKIAARGLIGLMVANAPKAIAPYGASRPIFGTNPIAFATPRPDGPPLVIDLSISQVARGKVMAAKKAGEAIPLGWALDAKGQPTTDPEAALAGTMVPIGGAKGTALALMVELLAAAFTGSAFSKDAGSFFTAEGKPPSVGQTMIALRPDAETGYLDRVGALLAEISAMDGVRLPGDRRRAAIDAAAREGVAIPGHLLAQARAMAEGR